VNSVLIRIVALTTVLRYRNRVIERPALKELSIDDISRLDPVC
jgi:hypothetical protein